MPNNFSTPNSPFPAPKNSVNSCNSPNLDAFPDSHNFRDSHHSGNSQNSTPLAGNPPSALFRIPPSGLLIIPDYCRCSIAELG